MEHLGRGNVMPNLRNLMTHKRHVLAAILVGAPLLGAIIVSVSDATQKGPLIWAMLVTAVFIAVILGLLGSVSAGGTNANRKKFGYLELLLGTDGRVSTSKTAVATWTLVLAASLMLLSVLVWFGNLSAEKAFGDDWDAYFLLLGGPFASAVLAKGITAGKVATGEISKTPTVAAGKDAQTGLTTDSTTPKASDTVTNDNGEISMPDTQYVVFTLVAIAYFVGAFITNIVDYAQHSCSRGGTGAVEALAGTCTPGIGISLPAIPSALLGLTSLAALTYVGSKALEKGGVRVVSVTPAIPLASQPLVVTLVNAGAAATQDNVTFLFAPSTGAPIPRAPALPPQLVGGITTLTVNPPPAGTYDVVINTPNGVTSAFQVTFG